MSNEAKREIYFDRAFRMEVLTEESIKHAIRSTECQSRILLQDAFPSEHFVTADHCEALPSSRRFRIGCSWWSDSRREVVVALNGPDECEVPISQRDLFQLLRAGHVVPVGGP
jgi:hypothetical protein